MSDYDESFDCAIVVDGLPVVDDSKYDKLVTFVKKKFGAFGTILDIDMPKSADQKTYGFMFILYNDKLAANAALELDRKPMDKSNIFRVSKFNDFEKYKDTPDEYVAPDVSSILKAKPDLNSWLLDPQLRDQFAIRYLEDGGSQTAIYWDDSHFSQDNYGRALDYNAAEIRSSGKSWTEGSIQWSVTGQYFATFHDQGIVLWGGERYERIGRLSHDRVSGLSFSPCDRFAITHSIDNSTGNSIYKIWDLATCTPLRIFDDISSSEPFPALKWSFDGSYLARYVYSTDKEGKKAVVGISVFVAPTFQQLDNKMIPAADACELSWSPSANLLSYALPGKNINLPSSVNLMAIPSREVVRSKHVFSMTRVHTYWQASGDHLAIYTARRKTKKTEKHTIEVLAVNVKNMPVHEVDIEERPLMLVFDPINPVFGCVYEVPSPRNPALKLAEVCFYRISNTGTKEIGKYTYSITPGCNASSTKLFFSPAGGVCIIAAVQPATSMMQFIDVSKEKTAIISNFQGANEHSHHKCSDIIWDPSGRHVATISSRSIHSEINPRARDYDSYAIWSFHGNKIVDAPVQYLYYFLWRPRPASSLTEKKVEEVKKNLKSVYWKLFEAEEDKARQAKKNEANKDRLRIKAEWKKFRDEATQWVKDNHPATIYDETADLIEVEQMVWEVVSVVEESA